METETMPISGKKIFPLPQHVAIIMDGNGRWARRQGLPRLAGHRAGTDNVRKIVEAVNSYGVKWLTLYAFSTENWRRPGREVNGILHILAGMIDRETQALHKKNVRLSHLGRLDGLSPALKSKVLKAVELTKSNSGITLCIAFDYGGRAEILDAVRRIVKDKVPPEKLDETLFNKYLYTADVPEPDLIIRTGGEMRLSNFLIWQAAYSEFYTTPTLWPDFAEEDIEKAFIAYSQRERRFGGLKDEGEAETS